MARPGSNFGSGLLALALLAGGASGQVVGVGYDPLGTALADAATALDAGDHGAAVEAAERALALAPRSAEARLTALRALNAAGRHARALEVVEVDDELALGPDLTLELGHAARGVGRLDDAEQAFERVLTDYAASGPARAALVELRIERGDDAGAWKALGPLRIQAPELPWGVATEARLLARGGDLEAARALLGEHLERDDAAGSVRSTLVELLLEPDPARALELAGDWIDHPPSEDARLLAGRAALAAGDDLTALEVALTGLRKQPASSSALELANAALGKRGRVAERLLERRLEQIPGDVGARAALARRILDAGDFGAARALLSDAPNTHPTLELLAAEAARRAGDTDDAARRLEALIAAPSPPARAFYERGSLRVGTGDLEGAATDFERAAADARLRAQAEYNRGAVLERLERHAESARAYEAALAVDPGLVQAWLQLGNHYHFRLGQRDRAAEAYRRFLELGGEDPQVRGWLEEVDR